MEGAEEGVEATKVIHQVLSSGDFQWQNAPTEHPGWEAQLCTCLGSVVDTLKPTHAELLRRVDLNGEPVQSAAKALKITPNSASVTLHRARKDLREKLRAFCGACADGACLDCDCAPVPEKRKRV